MSNVIRFPARMRRPLAKCTDGAALTTRDCDVALGDRSPLVAVELTDNSERIAIVLPFASALVDARTARTLAWSLLHLANELEARAE